MDTLTRQMDSLKSCAPASSNGGEEAFLAVLALWRKRLALTPDPSLGGAAAFEPAARAFVPQGERGEFTSSFPWPQVKRSLAALVTGYPPAPNNGDVLPRYRGAGGNLILALICAGNTPLLAWPAMLFAVRHGVRLYVKMSRDETLWPRLLKESVEEVSPEAAARIELGVWPGEDERTERLVELSDAVIAYGSDATIERLKTLAGEKPFQGFGHALSVALCLERAHVCRLALDILTFDQSGCLSPQVIFVAGDGNETSKAILSLTAALRRSVSIAVNRRDLQASFRVREIRDLAFMDGAKVICDENLAWTIIQYEDTRSIAIFSGPGVVSVISMPQIARFGEYLGVAEGRLSGVGFCGKPSPFLRSMAERAGASYLCEAGKMQTPPLSWKNGGVDLEAWIAELGQG